MEGKAGGKGDYHAALLGFLETAADEAGVDPFRIYTEDELVAEVTQRYDYNSKSYPAFVNKAMQTKRPLIKKVTRRVRKTEKEE